MLTQSQYKAWLKEPVTKAVIQALKDLEVDTALGCGRGAALEDPNHTIAENYLWLQGNLHVLNRIVDEDNKGKSFLCHDLLIEAELMEEEEDESS